MRKRERKRESEKERENKREKERESVCERERERKRERVCVCETERERERERNVNFLAGKPNSGDAEKRRSSFLLFLTKKNKNILFGSLFAAGLFCQLDNMPLCPFAILST
jgi:hypothetical protein